MDSITIGEGSNLQDGCVVHTDTGYPAVGHRRSAGERPDLCRAGGSASGGHGLNEGRFSPTSR